MSSRTPIINPSQAIRALKRAGFFVHHQTGSHVIMRHIISSLRVVVPDHRRDLKRGTTHQIILDAGLTAEEFKKLL